MCWAQQDWKFSKTSQFSWPFNKIERQTVKERKKKFHCSHGQQYIVCVCSTLNGIILLPPLSHYIFFKNGNSQRVI